MRGSKYDALRDYLLRCREAMVTLSLEEIEEVLGFELPPSAETPNWWANTKVLLGRAQTHAWLDAGFEASLQDHWVVFRKAAG